MVKLILVYLVHHHIKGKFWIINRANYLKISEELGKIDWENLIRNAHVDCMTKLFSDLFLQILSLNISNKIIICNDNDAPWVTSEVKTAIKRNTRVHRKWVFRDRNSDDRHFVRTLRNETNRLIKNARKKYYVNLGIKLCNYDTGSKYF